MLLFSLIERLALSWSDAHRPTHLPECSCLLDGSVSIKARCGDDCRRSEEVLYSMHNSLV
jgi:hypothetical protein